MVLHYKDKVASDVFKFNVVSKDEVGKLLSNFNVAKATGCNGISESFLKDSVNVVSSPMTYIVNLSLCCSPVSDDFKQARVVPFVA